MVTQELSQVSLETLGIRTRLNERLTTLDNQLTPQLDPDSPIGQKYAAVDGAKTLGKPVEAAQPTPDRKGQYQQFEKGTIFHTAAYGAMMIHAVIFAKWKTLSVGQQRQLGAPVQDSFGHRIGKISGQIAYFEKGMLGGRTSHIYRVQNHIYVHYRNLGGPGVLGFPTSDPESVTGGGLRSRFLQGQIYWHSRTGASLVKGAILNRWRAIGGIGFFGYPTTDETPIYKGRREVGRYSRFEKGTIYWSPATGAQDVYGAIRDCWERELGGVTGSLGFPKSGETATPRSGGRYNNFEGGVIVWHPGDHPFAGVRVIRGIKLFMDRFATKGDDGWLRGGQDLYVKVDIQASTGQQFKQRLPRSGDYGSDEEIDRVFLRVPVAQSDLVITVKMEGWDSDSPDRDDRLGVINERYTLDNLWGLYTSNSHWNGNFLAVYRMQSGGIINRHKPFREQFFWPFRNFSTASLSFSQYAQTFRDVADLKASATDPSTWRPFDRLFYEVAYKSIAGGGNCFGVCLESVYAHVGRSLYDEPIYRFGPKGSRPDPARASDRDLINEINLKHGYQVGAGIINWFLGQFALGRTHNPKYVFEASRDAFRRGDYPILVLTGGYFNVGGHVVRPYEWDTRDPDRWIMRIADPNVPYQTQANKNHKRCIVEVNPRTNRFKYYHRDDEIWSGSGWSGGRMYAIPFSVLCRQPRTPFWEVLTLLTSGTLLLLGDEGETEQITDAFGRNFYDASIKGRPSQWQHIQQSRRIPRMARVPLLDFDRSGQPPELYSLEGKYAKNLDHQISRRRGQDYRWAMQSANLSAFARVAESSGSDTLRVEDINSESPAIALTSAASSRDKAVTLAMAGGLEQQKEFELKNILVRAGRTLKTRLDDAGQQLLLENDGPDTEVEIQVTTRNLKPGTARPRQVKLAAGKAARLRPADWSAGAINKAPLKVDVLDDLRGPVRHRFEVK